MDPTLITAPPSSTAVSTGPDKAVSGLPRLSLPALLVALAAVCVLLADIPVARLVKSGKIPDVIEKLLEACEHFGTPFGLVIAALLICMLDPARRRSLLRLGTAAVAGGMSANIVKLCVPRVRPKYLEQLGDPSTYAFAGWPTSFSAGSRLQSFPSAHTAMAVAFCVALTFVYPRGRVAFVLLAAGVGLQRIATSSHYPSDVLTGAAIGAVMGLIWTTPTTPVGRRLEAFENSP